jgi:class 3 adenylate cyclase
MSQRDVAEGDPLQQARAAYDRNAWREAYDLFAAVDAAGGLTAGEDFERLAEAAFWTAHVEEHVEAWERAHAAASDAGDTSLAARAGFRLFFGYYQMQSTSLAMGWLARTIRLLADEPECAEHGMLSYIQTNMAMSNGDLDGAFEQATRTLDIGTRLGDRDLQALGLFDQGNILVAKGQVDEGMALLEEATVAAVSGELGPFVTGTIYCAMITTCERLADYGRAAEWTDAAQRWCGRQSISGFPGLCRVHRAEIMRLRGAWGKAEEEATLARDELRGWDLEGAAEALYQIGEIRLRMGDLPSAEDAFAQAHEMGRDPQPGLSLLRLAEGKTEAAADMINRAAARPSLDRLARARLLPAQTEIALAAGDLEVARAAAGQQEEIAEAYRTPALRASAACGRGALSLAEGDAVGARDSLRAGWRLWQEVDAPYEVARARMLLAGAHRAEGDAEAANLELRSARSAFERLGATLDARRAAELQEAGTVAAAEPAASRRVTRTFMFTDIVKSTALIEAIGDDAWEDLLRWHDQTLRALFSAHGGEEVKHGGDGFFVAFADAASAVDCAVATQRTLTQHRGDHGFAPQVRIGLHTAAATRRGDDYSGKGVHQAARIGALAEGGEILASRDVVDAGAPTVHVSAPRDVTLKGISEPMSVVAVEWRAQ